MGSFQTSRHFPSYGHRLGPRFLAWFLKIAASLVLQTTCQPLQSFHCDILYFPAQRKTAYIRAASKVAFLTLMPFSDPYPLGLRRFHQESWKNSRKTSSLPPPLNLPTTYLKFQRSVRLQTHQQLRWFLPRDAMHARYILALCVRLSVCV